MTLTLTSPLGHSGEDDMSQIKATFTLGVDGTDIVEGFYNPDHNWNGWAVPSFAMSEIIKLQRIFAQWAADGFGDCATIDIDKAGRVFIVSDWGRDEIEPLDTTDTPEPLFPIGAYEWTWQRVEA